MVSPIKEWFHVTFDDSKIHIHVEAPGLEEWKASISWSEIIRVCFKTGDFTSPDDIYIFINSRPESYLIPTDANGGADLWGEFINRGLFDAELAIKAATSPEDSLFCRPED
ncbi:MAG: hypothetical protein P1Q69_12800 [Candidatus Thorarchaeota archaeon]|nr:hypothetical protein [Candidatus Thorarchaeota archaeon]